MTRARPSEVDRTHAHLSGVRGQSPWQRLSRHLVVCLLALAISNLHSTVLGVTISMSTIGNPGNADYIFNGHGAVAYTYDIGTYETTNQQYVDFLNAVGPSNPNGIYNSKMGSDPNGGIVQSGSPGSYTYSVKGGVNPAGSPYGSIPVMFVSWFSVARFANWLTNGQQTGAAGVNSLETGSYTLNNATSGPLPSRNTTFLAAHRGYVLPNMEEWFKAAFHDASGLTATDYTLWPTGSSTQPASPDQFPGYGSVANYGRVLPGPISVGAYGANSRSLYGLEMMLGNAAEITETRNPVDDAMYQVMSGSWSTSKQEILNFNAILGGGKGTFVDGTATTPQIGFRIAAVPEPNAVARVGVCAALLAGLRSIRRRTPRPCSSVSRRATASPLRSSRCGAGRPSGRARMPRP
jgi:formylglycine-generating enzyme required for sulfatase activity